MEIIKISEWGYEEAALGFSLSYNSTIERTKQILPKYAFGKPGENKFLEMIMIWLDISAPRFWWAEADTYRVGESKQSESTMHTIKKNIVSQKNFEYPISQWLIDYINGMIKNNAQLVDIKNILPEGFIQRRIWMFSYKTLQNIYVQRKEHKLKEWHIFLDSVLSQIQHPEFIQGE